MVIRFRDFEEVVLLDHNLCVSLTTAFTYQRAQLRTMALSVKQTIQMFQVLGIIKLLMHICYMY